MIPINSSTDNHLYGWLMANDFDSQKHSFVSITLRAPSGRYERDELLIVTKMEAIALKLQYGKDFDDLSYLVED